MTCLCGRSRRDGILRGNRDRHRFGDMEEGIFETTNYYAEGTAMTLLDDALKFSGPPFIDVSQVNAALGYQIIIRNAVGSIGPKAIVLCAVPSNSVIVCS